MELTVGEWEHITSSRYKAEYANKKYHIWKVVIKLVTILVGIVGSLQFPRYHKKINGNNPLSTQNSSIKN